MIEEIERFGRPSGLVRIPPETDVPLSPRVTRLVDTSVMRRLSRITQLGLVHLVYPGATHSRLEHSLGVYRNALLVLQNLSAGDTARPAITPRSAEAFVLAALLHDAGHWPFCHAIEDMRIEGLSRHETRVAELVRNGPVADRIASDWNCDGDDVMSLLMGKRVGTSTLSDDAIELLASCLSGPIDVDKLDYLVRDSLHAGVPYGRHFDAARLVAAMTRDPRRPRLAITEKGRTAAEMMVFARYVMFSEVYWHHAVRSATAMLQRSVHLLRHLIDLESLMRLDDAAWIDSWRSAAEGTPAAGLVDGLFGPTRSLYKRVAEFNVSQRGELHKLLARRPHWWLVACAEELSRLMAAETGLPISPCDILIDAPPVKLEVDINVTVVTRDGDVKALADVSPVADALARQQFDDHVKRVRIFVHPTLRDSLAPLLNNDTWIVRAVEKTRQDLI
jgi:HD superfamily phosphohydrolase